MIGNSDRELITEPHVRRASHPGRPVEVEPDVIEFTAYEPFEVDGIRYEPSAKYRTAGLLFSLKED